MENTNLLWRSSVKKAFCGFVALSICRALSMLCSLMLLVGVYTGADMGMASVVFILSILSLVAVVFYFFGVGGMKKCAAGSLVYDGIAKLYKGSVCLFVSNIVSILMTCLRFLPLISLLATILALVGFFLTYKGFSSMAKLRLNDHAKKGAKQLSLMAVLSIVVCVSGVVPVVGVVIGLLLSIVIVVYAFWGWRNFVLITLELPEETQTMDDVDVENKKAKSDSEEGCSEEREDSFWLNRWIAKLANWFDGGVFELDADSSSLCVASFWVGILAGSSIAVAMMIDDGSSFQYWALGIAGAIVLLLITLQAIR